MVPIKFFHAFPVKPNIKKDIKNHFKAWMHVKLPLNWDAITNTDANWTWTC
jgi:hypothetical protein